MTLTLAALVLMAPAALKGPADENPVFQELIQKGVTMSDGTAVKLRPPILADGLDAAGQRAALAKADARTPVEKLVRKSYSTPVVVKVRSAKSSEDEGPAVRMIDLWFVVHGDWNTLTSGDFLGSFMKPKDKRRSRVVSKSGVLSDKELAARKLTVMTRKGYEERFAYSTFSLFERVELSATRFAVVASGKDSLVAAGKTDPRFARDAEYPNQWRALLRDEQAEIKPGPAHPLGAAGGYAKITRLADPPDAVLIECHIVYEEPYGWFDGANLVKQKAPLMVQAKVRTFRRKLALASAENSEKAKEP